MSAGGGEEGLVFTDAAALEAWLEEHHAASDGIWIRMARKGTGIPSLDWAGAVEVLLCFGWIDSRVRRFDDTWFLQRVTPRRPRSTWSKVNREKVAALLAAGRMRPAGLAEVERARADGRWDAAYDGVATATVPPDLHDALVAAGQREAFDALDSRNGYAILHRVQSARRADTRARRIADCTRMLAGGRTIH